jgi:integrase
MYWAVMLAVATGMRRGEIVALRWKNIDFENKTILVVESVEQVKQVLRFKAPKTDKTRAIVLPDYAIEELKEWKEAQSKELNRLGCKASEDTFVCGRSWDGGVLKPDSLSAQFWTMIRGVPDFPVIRFHDLRHTHATQLLKQRIHPKIAQERLGHSTITTTLDMYSHAVETMQEDAVSKLDAAYKVAMKSKTKQTPTLG